MAAMAAAAAIAEGDDAGEGADQVTPLSSSQSGSGFVGVEAAAASELVEVTFAKLGPLGLKFTSDPNKTENSVEILAINVGTQAHVDHPKLAAGLILKSVGTVNPTCAHSFCM